MNTETPYTPPGSNPDPGHDTLPGRTAFFNALPNLALLVAFIVALAAIAIGLLSGFELAVGGMILLLIVIAIWSYSRYFGQRMAE